MSTPSGPRRIVVGVDESDGAAEALRWAVREAHLDGAELVAVMAWGWLDQHHLLEAATWDPEYGADEAHAALGRYVELAVGEQARERVETRAIVDLPASTLLAASSDAQLLVVGARGLGGFRGLLLGSVSQQCLHRSSVPVAIIRPDATPERADSKRIVVAVDGSDGAQRAFRWSVAEARRRAATLDVVHVWQPAVSLSPLPVDISDPSKLEAGSRRLLDRVIAADDTAGVSLNLVTRRAPTVPGILGSSESAGLLVVGSRGQGAFERTVLGSIATQVSHHATCPLVVVPATAT